ncbi:MAG: FHA domain-containing protein [Coleofasciculaceae cyanobacterium]
MEIEQRLGLYQVFLKLYEHHRPLLDEILQLEKTSTTSGITTRCVTGIIQGQVHLVTNLVEGKTQSLHQPQGIWTIGRDRLLTISIPDRRLSRRHAVIQYIHNQGFYLIDLNSTNGSFVNGEPVQGRLLLKDGDRIRLSSFTFSFFLCNDCQTTAETPADVLAQLESSIAPTLTTIQPLTTPELPIAATITPEKIEQPEETFEFLKNISKLEEPIMDSSIAQLNATQQAEILDRFFNRRLHKSSKNN